MSSATPSSARIPFDVHLMILEHCNFGTVHSYSFKLLRTLVNRPELALEETYLAKQRTYPANPDSVKLATKLVQKLDLPDANYWDYALSHTSLDPCIAILLSQLTSIEEISLGLPLLPKSTHIGRMFPYVMHSETLRYGHLRRVYFADLMAWNHSAGLDFDSELYMALFHLPSLKEPNLTIDTPNFIPSEAGYGSGSLWTIRLLRSRVITPDTVGNLSKLTPNLETLYLDWSVFDEEGEDTVDCARVGSAIAESWKTLGALTIEVHLFNDELIDDPTYASLEHQLGSSLCTLDALEHLKVPIPVLLGKAPWRKPLAITLPNNLKSLVLSLLLLDSDFDVGDMLIGFPTPDIFDILTLVRDYPKDSVTHAPRLEHLVLDFTSTGPRLNPSVLAEELEASNVTMDIVYYDTSSRTRARTLTIHDRQTPDLGPVLCLGGPRRWE
ncbi:hypothetical protein BJX65DRAFT_304164 [Aspergillus insuetus]